MSDFTVSSDYPGYVFVGCATGTFEGSDRQRHRYANMYVISPVSSFQSDEYQASGWKAEKKSCVSSEVWKDIDIGCKVKLFFDDKQRVVMVALDE